MNQSKHLNIVIIFALFMQTLFFQFALPSLVLCFGEDGHIAFEWNDNSEQCEPEESIYLKDLVKDVKDFIEKPETDCTDINLHFHVSYAEKSKNQKYPPIISENFLKNYISDSEKFNQYSFIKLQHITETNHILDTIQSTVLII